MRLDVTAAFKEAPPGWTLAQPQDAAPKGVWWSIYHDPLLDRLESQVAINNQNVKQYEAQYREAQATVDVARSALFPTINGTASATRSSGGSGGGATTTGGPAAAVRAPPTRWKAHSTGIWTCGAASAARWRATLPLHR